jgi:hypothetical protein
MGKKAVLFISFVLAVCLVASPLARAATRTWDHEGGDNRWDTAANWSSDKIPGSSDTARIVMTGADEARIDGAVETQIGKIQVGWVVDDVALAGDLRLLGGVLTLTKSSQVGRASTGGLYVEGGTFNPRAMDIGDDPGGVGTFTLSDGTVSLGNTDVDWKTLYIGRDGATGSATISGGALHTGTINVGNQPDSVGMLVISGGTVSTGDIGNTNAFNVANSGATGTATISDGVISVSGYLNVGNGTNVTDDIVTASNGLLDVLGGTISIGFADTGLDWRDLRIGHNEGTGVMNMSGGTININGGIKVGSTNIETIEDPFEEILHPGTGTLTMTGGTISAADANALEIGTLESTGWVDLLGGTIKAGDLLIGTDSGMNITEGMLILAGDKMRTVLDNIDAGLLTAYGGWSGADWQYDYNVRNAGMTTVTAIPEPATVALLSLGALVLLRRRRKR